VRSNHIKIMTDFGEIGMRLILSMCCVLATSCAADAQLISLEHMMQVATAQCVSERLGEPHAPRYCSCWVSRWVGLWDANDRIVWSQTGSATPHMRQMEQVAAELCATFR